MKIVKTFIFFIYFIIFIPNVSAAECTNAEKVSLGKEAVGVKVGYKEMKAEKDPNTYVPADRENTETNYISYYNYFELQFFNLTENLFIELKNDYNSDIQYIRYNDLDNGIYRLNWNNINQVTTFNYKIIASDNTNCSGKVMKTGIITTPAYNPYYNSQRCETIPDYYLCQKYISTSIDYNYFAKKVDAYLEKINKTPENKEEDKSTTDIIQDFISENKNTILIITIGVFLVIGVAVVVIIRKRRSRLI